MGRQPNWWANITGLMLLGAADDIAPPASCDSAAKGMPPEKLRVMTYSDAPQASTSGDCPRNGHLGAPAYNAEAAKASWAAVVEFLR
jgi:hypothetical protein